MYSTYGIHPKHALEYDDAQQNVTLLCLTSNMAKPNVVGIREIVLDYMHAERLADLPDAKDRQHQMLKKILLETLKMPAFASMPLIMHIRDITSYREEAHLNTIKILQECGVDPTHPIYLHCFVGSTCMAQAWMDAYPDVTFGFHQKFWFREITRICPKCSGTCPSLVCWWRQTLLLCRCLKSVNPGCLLHSMQ